THATVTVTTFAMARATIHRIPVGKTAAPRRAPARRKEVPWVHPADIDGATLERARDLIEQGRVTVRALSQLDCHVHVPGRYADATVIAVVLNVAAGYGHVRVTNGSASGQVAPLTMD